MPKTVRATVSDCDTIERMFRSQKRMQKSFLSCHKSLMNRLIECIEANAIRPAPAAQIEPQIEPEFLWICPVCLHPFVHRDSLKGHVRSDACSTSRMLLTLLQAIDSASSTPDAPQVSLYSM